MKKKAKQKIIIICGPTGSGKSGIAIDLCQKFDGSIISADSRQIYKRMDIGTGKEFSNDKYKVSKKEDKWIINNIDVYGYDIVCPNEEFSVSHFEKKVFQEYLPKIKQEQKVPFLVGGTGFYIRAIIDGIRTSGIAPNYEFRKRMKEVLKEKGVEALWRKLKNIDTDKAMMIDRNNPRRIIRALEVIDAKKRGFKLKKREVEFDPLFVGITWKREELYYRIDERIDQMIKNGLVEEIEDLLNNGYDWSLPALNSIGYIELKPFFEGKQTLSECVEKLKFNTHAYARRQLTWFRKEKRIHCFDLKKENYFSQMRQLTKRFLEDSQSN